MQPYVGAVSGATVRIPGMVRGQGMVDRLLSDSGGLVITQLEKTSGTDRPLDLISVDWIKHIWTQRSIDTKFRLRGEHKLKGAAALLVDLSEHGNWIE